MAKIYNFKDTEGIEKEQQFLNCNKTMREHFCWATGSTQQLSAQQATYLLGKELREHDTAYFKVTDGLKVYYEGMVFRTASNLYCCAITTTGNFEF